MDERPITTRGFDMERGEILRIFRFYALNRLLPLGYFAGLTRFRELAVLFVIHQWGAGLFAKLIAHEALLTRLYVRLRGTKRVLSARPSARG